MNGHIRYIPPKPKGYLNECREVPKGLVVMICVFGAWALVFLGMFYGLRMVLPWVR